MGGPPIQFTDEELVGYIHAYRAEHGYAPSVREAAAHFDVAASSVQLRLTSLLERGVISRPHGIPRAIMITPVGMKMVTERL